MPEFKNIEGQKFGRWKVLYRAPNRILPSGMKYTAWHCVCECGIERDVLAQSLLNGKTKSCGCAHAEDAQRICHENFVKHGESKTRLYGIWIGMKKRCYNPRSSNYKNYGERGITICDEWKNDYMAFKNWAIHSGYKDSLSIDRINVNGNYSPDNCRWVDCICQNNNRRSNNVVEYNGESRSIAEWARILGISYSKLYKAIHNKGKTISEIISA